MTNNKNNTNENEKDEDECECKGELRNKILLSFVSLTLMIAAIYAPVDLNPHVRNFTIYGVPTFLIARFVL